MFNKDFWGTDGVKTGHMVDFVRSIFIGNLFNIVQLSFVRHFFTMALDKSSNSPPSDLTEKTQSRNRVDRTTKVSRPIVKVE